MWQSLIKQLQAAGMTQAVIARRSGLSQPSISNMASGKYKAGPRGQSALKLMRLYERHCKAVKPKKR